ncbi:MAG TPA: OsmC family protein [Holophagaceae bacterium]|nr:OsmC family protein [Holophagaceae bacterium]
MGSIATNHNGVNVEALTSTLEAIKANPALAHFKFRSKSKWINGAHSSSTFDSLFGAGLEHRRAKPLFLEGDEPEALLGTDLAPNAAESALHALSSCLSVTYAYNAAAMGIDISSLSFEMEADTDLQGFMELNKNIRPGLSDIHVKVNLACNGTTAQVRELHEKAMRTSPLLDTFRNPVNVKVTH